MSILRWRRWWIRSTCCWGVARISSNCAEQAGSANKIRWYDEQTFLTPDGGVSRIATSGLPAPLHFGPSFLGLQTLGLKDKLGMARGLMEFFRGYPETDEESVSPWLKRTGQTERSIRHFWSPIIMATLNGRPEYCSTKYAGKVFHELFVKSSTGGRLGIPTVPLSEFYASMARLLEASGGTMQLRCVRADAALVAGATGRGRGRGAAAGSEDRAFCALAVYVDSAVV
jgi:hypothetical protein